MLKTLDKTSLALFVTLTLGGCAQSPRQPTVGFNDSAVPVDTTSLHAVQPRPRRTSQSSAIPSANHLNRVRHVATTAKTPAARDSGDNLWQRIRARLALTHLYHPRIQPQIFYMSRNPNYLNSLAERSRPFLHYIVEETEQRGLPMELTLLPMVESGFQPTAISPKKAAGLWQFMPATGLQWGLTYNPWYDGRHDLQASTQAALDYLEYLYQYFNGDWLLALAAYNAGEGTVQRAIEANLRAGRETDYWSLNLPQETEQYVPKLLALSQLVANPNAYGLSLRTIANEPYLYRFDIGPEVNLSRVAALAGMSEGQLRFYNPCLKRDVTPPINTYELLLPRTNALVLLKKLEDLRGLADNRYLLVQQSDGRWRLQPAL